MKKQAGFPMVFDALRPLLCKHADHLNVITQVDTELFKELDTLTSAGHEYYVSEGYIDFAS